MFDKISSGLLEQNIIEHMFDKNNFKNIEKKLHLCVDNNIKV